MKFVKLLILIIVLSLSAFAFVACGINDDNNADNSSASDKVSEEIRKVEYQDDDFILALSYYKIDAYTEDITVKSPFGDTVSVDKEGKFLCDDIGEYTVLKKSQVVKKIYVLGEPFNPVFNLTGDIAETVYARENFIIPKAEISTEIESFDTYSVKVYENERVLKTFNGISGDIEFSIGKSGAHKIQYCVVDGFGASHTFEKTINILAKKEIININVPEENYIMNSVSLFNIFGVYENNYYPVEIELTDADGISSIITEESYIIPKSGNYALRFTSNIDGEFVQEIREFSVGLSEASLFSNGKNIVSTTPSENTVAKNGLEIVADGINSYVYYNQVIDLNNFTADDKIIDFYCLKNNVSDMSKIRISLIDVNDENNVVSVRWKKSASEGWGFLSYLLIEFNGYAIALDNEKGTWLPRETYGSIMTNSFISKTNPFNFTFSCEENAFYSYRTKTSNEKTKLLDLDDTEVLGSYLPWKGFSENKVYLRIDFLDNINSAIQIISVAGKDFTVSSVPENDENFLRFNHKGKIINGAEGTVIPAYVGYKCSLPVPIRDNLLAGAVDVKFSLLKSVNNDYVPFDVQIENYVFYPSQAGEYKAVYTYNNLYGEEKEKVFDFSVFEGNPPIISITYSDAVSDINSVYVIPEIVISGGTGELSQTITYFYNNKQVYPNEYSELYLNEKGYIEIWVKVEDEIGLTTEDYFYIDVNKNVQEIVIDEIPISFIAGIEYDLSDFIAIDNNFDEGQSGYLLEKSVYVDGVLAEGFKFTPDGLKKNVVISFYGGKGTSKETRKDITVAILPAVDNGKVNVNDYLLGSSVYTGELFEEGYKLAFNSDIEFTFANPLAADELQIEFTLVENKTNFGKIYFDIKDYIDPSQKIVISFNISSYDSVELCLNDVVIGKITGKTGVYQSGDLNGKKYVFYSLRILSDRKLITDEAYEIYCDIGEYTSRKAFVGFGCGYAVLNVGTDNCTGNSCLVLNTISNQSLTVYALKNGKDKQGPTIVLNGQLKTKYDYNQSITIPKASAYDFFQGKVSEITITVKTPGGDRIEFNGLEENGIVFDKYGNYTFEYYAEDSLGNSSVKKIIVSITDVIAPTININDSLPAKIKVGDALVFGNYEAADNIGVVKKSVFILTPNALYEEVKDGYTFKNAGLYTVMYYAKDAAGNSTIVSFDINVG